MKTCGIEIDKHEVIFVCLEKYDDDNIEITSDLKKISLLNDEDPVQIWVFFDLIKSHLDTINPDKVAIIKLSKGKFSASSISSKIEGILQLYRNSQIKLIAPTTLTAYYKKNDIPLTAKYKYQESALKLAYYLMIKA
ncbi:MAG: hypothetical protein JWP44_2796 [Mucilaginibacter sp.]|nr:hypothetical protein [Mucilaginibacter sp.]